MQSQEYFILAKCTLIPEHSPSSSLFLQNHKCKFSFQSLISFPAKQNAVVGGGGGGGGAERKRMNTCLIEGLCYLNSV